MKNENQVVTHSTISRKVSMWGIRTAHAFTLIELLVVILIIGILAAIALPQYQKAVERVRVSHVFPLVRAVVYAQEMYFLTNGKYADKFEQLDTTLSWTGKGSWNLNAHVKDSRSNGEWAISLGVGDNGGSSVVLGRLTGPYKGTGFVVYPQYIGTSGYKSNTLYCIEGKTKSAWKTIYSGAQGTLSKNTERGPP